MWKTITILVMFAKINVAELVGSCNQCFSGNKVACLNETHFVTCFQGIATATITKCPGNRFCTNDTIICQSAAEGYTPICYHSDYCGECEFTKGVVTCLNETTYGYCFGGKTPLESSLRSCPQEYVCNYNSPEVCVPEATNKPSCGSNKTNPTKNSTLITGSITTPTINSIITEQIFATTETTKGIPTTTKTTLGTEATTATTTGVTIKTEPRNSKKICEEIGSTGYFKSDDPTCREYVYCYLLSGQYLGWFYYCDGYFKAATQKCQKIRPSNCKAN